MKAGNNIPTWTAVCGLALVALVGAVIYSLAVPMPNYRKQWRQLNGKSKALASKVKASQKILADSKDQVSAHTWDMPADKVAPKVLTNLTELAKESGVKLNNFRPGKPVLTGPLPVVTFDVNAVGTYHQLLEFVRKSEEPETLLAVHAMKVTNSDGTTDTVNATVTFAGFVGGK